MRAQRSGFTLVELVVAIVIGSILMSIAMASFGNARRSLAVQGARTTFASLHARARAQAIELGGTVQLVVDATDEEVRIVRGGTTLETVAFDEDMGVTISSSEGDFTLCMNSRGYADTSCNTFSTTVVVTFTSGSESAGLRLLPLGQLQY